MSISIKTNKLIKPLSPIDFTEVMSEIDSIPAKQNGSNDHPAKKEINLIELARLYRLVNVPVVDFIMVYIVIYTFNEVYFNFDYKTILIATIPITIILNLLMDNKCKITEMVLLVLFISVIAIIRNKN